MSSHHIVRENQEPAVLIYNAHAIPFERVQELLEWMPVIGVLSTELEVVLSWGIKLDFVLCPVEEQNFWREQLIDQNPIVIVTYDQRINSFQRALDYLIQNKFRAVYILGSATDDLMQVRKYPDLDVEFFIDNKRWSRVRSGVWEKWVAANTMLYLYPQELWGAARFDNGMHCPAKDGLFRLALSQSFWIGEDLI